MRDPSSGVGESRDARAGHIAQSPKAAIARTATARLLKPLPKPSNRSMNNVLPISRTAALAVVATSVKLFLVVRGEVFYPLGLRVHDTQSLFFPHF